MDLEDSPAPVPAAVLESAPVPSSSTAAAATGAVMLLDDLPPAAFAFATATTATAGVEAGAGAPASSFPATPLPSTTTTTTTAPTTPLGSAMDEEPFMGAAASTSLSTAVSSTPQQQQQHALAAAPPLAAAAAAVPSSAFTSAAAGPPPPQALLHGGGGGREVMDEEEEDDDEEEEEVVKDDLQAAAMAAEVPAWALSGAVRPVHQHPDALLPHVEEEDDEDDDDDSDDEEEAAIVGGGGAADDNEERGSSGKGGARLPFEASDIPRTKHELAPQAVEEEVVIPAEAALELAGAVEGMVEGFLVVAADPARQTLDIDNALCFDDRTPLGRVHEVFGPVKKPYYAVLNAHVERLRAQGREALLTRGTPVYYVPQASCFVQPTIIYTRGSDASGEHDEEPPEDELEFSDDEQEALHRRQRKKKLQDKRRQAHAETQEWEGNAEMALRTGAPAHHTSSAPAGRGRGERGRRRAANRGGYAGGGWSRGPAPPMAHGMPYAPAAAAGGGGHHAPGEYTPLQRPSHLVDHVMSNPAYGAASHGQQAYLPPQQQLPSLVPYGTPYGHMAYPGAQPMPMPMPMPMPAAPGQTQGQAQPQAMPLPMPLPMPPQAYPGGPPMYPPGAQASWQNQFYASPHHHNSSS